MKKEEIEIGSIIKIKENNYQVGTIVEVVSLDEKNPQAFGFNSKGRWCGDVSHGWNFLKNPNIWESATLEEFEIALNKEAKKRGFKEGVEIESCMLYDLVELKPISSNTFNYEECCDGCYHLRDDYGTSIFCDGKWAEIKSE